MQKEGNITLEINVAEHDLQTGHVSAATSAYINIGGSTKHDTKNKQKAQTGQTNWIKKNFGGNMLAFFNFALQPVILE